jgi:hypothetical protein
MRRPLIILLAASLASAALVGLSSSVARRLCACHLAGPVDDLAWLRHEFRLGEAAMQRVRQLHEGYVPKCHEICQLIAARKQELQAALEAGKGVTPEAEQKLAEIARLRVACQTQMLRHFHEVSLAMPPEQGRRYLAEMQRLTLGFHEQFERAMAPKTPSAHGHH